jgi:hypothetical protein
VDGPLRSRRVAVEGHTVARALLSSRCLGSSVPENDGNSPGYAVSVEGGDQAMVWETPECIEIKMDAELSSYQEDLAG